MLIAGVLVATRLLDAEESRPVAWRDLSGQVGPLRITGRESRPLHNQEELAPYMARAKGRDAMQQVDFSYRQLLLVSPGPRSLGGPVEARVAHPYRLLSLPAGKGLAVDWVGR